MAVALYARKSVERENSVSCETQLEYCRAMLKPDEKTEPVLTFVDNGFSGGDTDRDGFQEMMRRIETGEIGKIIVYRLDRISRSLSDFVGILETLKRHGVAFVSSQESFDTSSPYGEMIVKLLMVFAEFERQSIISRVTQAYAHRSELGLFMGGRAPYGFALTETSVSGIPTKMLAPTEEIAQVRLIFEAYGQSGMTLHRLMKHLNGQGILPPEGNWSTGKLSAILKNPVYVRADSRIRAYFMKEGVKIVGEAAEFDGIHGVQMYGQSGDGARKIVVMRHEGVIPSELWLRCREKLDNNRRFGKSAGNGTSWLGGMLVCGMCGRTMSVIRGGKRKDGTQTRYFRCPGKNDGVCPGTDAVLYAESLESLAVTVIGEKLAEFSDCRIPCGDSAELNRLKNRLAELKESQNRLADLALRDGLDGEMLTLLNERARSLAAQSAETEEKIRLTEENAYELIRACDLADGWQHAEYEERREVCRLLVHRITVEKDGTAEVIWNL
ncbi:MAG: recombinase family protein [Clostridia bacterium]|nr:recombinase family protein [Clostridia bacterium]